jgi:hypothetical protein
LDEEQIVTIESRPRQKAVFPPQYDPLGTCPPELKVRYEKAALRAQNGSLAAILKLKCLECVAWQQSEVRRCEITGCALWPRARKDLCIVPDEPGGAA